LLEQLGTQPVPVLCSPELAIIDGHALWAELRELGVAEVFVAIVQNQSAAEINALRLSINRIPLDTRWDEARLRQEISALIDLSFDLELTAFDACEIDALMRIDLPEANLIEDEFATGSTTSAAVAIAGDIFVLGPHRIGCGDAADGTFVQQVRKNQLADKCFVDPPYNVRIDGFVSGKGRARHRDFLEASGELSSQEFFAFLHDTLGVLRAASSPRALIYACMDFRHILEMTAAGRLLGMHLLNICVWTKNNGGMGSLYRSRHEMICVFKAGSEQHINNVELGRFGRNRTNVWSHPGMSAFGADRGELLASHPTVKPVALVADAIRDVTKRGDCILDTFLGSGTTLIAAEETGRRCVGLDLDPGYIDLAVRRWQKLAGCDAYHEASGLSFDDLAAQRQEPTRKLTHGR
jgi:DNA modification methylase